MPNRGQHKPPGPTTTQRRIIELLRDYRGMPLGVVDVVQELHLGQRTAQRRLTELAKAQA